MTDAALIQRLEQLERQTRWQHLALIILLSGAGVFVLTAQSKSDVIPLIRTNRLVLVDELGHEAATLGFIGKMDYKPPALIFTTLAEQTTTVWPFGVMVANPDRGGVNLMSHMIGFSNAKDRSTVSLGADHNDRTALSMFRSETESLVTLHLGSDGKPEFMMAHRGLAVDR